MLPIVYGILGNSVSNDWIGQLVLCRRGDRGDGPSHSLFPLSCLLGNASGHDAHVPGLLVPGLLSGEEVLVEAGQVVGVPGQRGQPWKLLFAQRLIDQDMIEKSEPNAFPFSIKIFAWFSEESNSS